MSEEQLTLWQNNYVDLVSNKLGAEALSCSDEFFAPKENLLKPEPSIFIPDKYTERGKWMDGWESRRSYGRIWRTESNEDYDWCIIRLGVPGSIVGVDIDTAHFKGNAPLTATLEACSCDASPTDSTTWTTIVDNQSLTPDSHNLFQALSNVDDVYTHVKLKIYPDGGVARLRVYGSVAFNPMQFLPGELIDVAAVSNGGFALTCSDMFFSHKNNLIMPGKGVNMGDGWETKRRRDPGPDWVIIKLGSPATINKVLLDTQHFKGNYPDHFTLQAMNEGNSKASSQDTITDDEKWLTIIGETPLFADREHLFIIHDPQHRQQIFTHIKLNIFPDGGVSRLRVFGYLEQNKHEREVVIGLQDTFKPIA
ncbi:allantoicase [Flocculibacter collagenilyticus]|uniref:allantoicase n=1 Tax=Flocculibacter collagenilyticus TaxID=2744479 RepID=UPI0018F5C847|nr:allantoicase [Flocculibacter collagenilyticus]